MTRSALGVGLLFLVVAVISGLAGYGAFADHAGGGAKVLAVAALVLSIVCLLAGWLFHHRAAVRLATAQRVAAWSR